MTKKKEPKTKPDKPKKCRKGIGGQPTKYNKEIAARICDLIATTSIGLSRLCAKHDELPDPTTIYLWRHTHPEFSKQYARAKAKQAEYLAEEIIDISDNGTNDFMESLKPEQQGVAWKLNGEHVQRSRLRVDTRKWIAAKLLPKVYGDQKIIDTLEGENDSLRSELRELRAQLDSKNKKEY